MSNVKFEDYSVNVKNVIKDTALKFLYEIGGEIRSKAQRNSRKKTSQTAGSYEYKVDENELAVHIGSNHWNAIYEEFGTGIHAENGDGRKGFWIYVIGKGGQPEAPKGGKTYHDEKEVRKKVAIMRSKGLDAHYTCGKRPNKPLRRAFKDSNIQSKAESYFGGM